MRIMNREQINEIIEKWIEESWQKMYEEMTSDPIRKLMFRYACSKKWPF